MRATRKEHEPLLDGERHDKIIAALRAGNYLTTAAEYAGVSRRTVYVWIDKGEAAAMKEEAGEALNEYEQRYLAFARDVEQARAAAETRSVALIQTAAQSQWQAAAWWLERTNPKRWGRRVMTEVTGADGGPLDVNVSVSELEAAVHNILSGDDTRR